MIPNPPLTVDAFRSIAELVKKFTKSA